MDYEYKLWIGALVKFINNADNLWRLDLNLIVKQKVKWINLNSNLIYTGLNKLSLNMKSVNKTFDVVNLT